MDCVTANDLLVEYLYREMGNVEKKALEAHLRQCARCAADLESLKATRAMVQKLPEVDPPDRIKALSLARAESAGQSSRVSPAVEPAVLEVFVFRNGNLLDEACGDKTPTEKTWCLSPRPRPRYVPGLAQA